MLLTPRLALEFTGAIQEIASSGALSTGKTQTCWSGNRGGHKNDLRAGAPLL